MGGMGSEGGLRCLSECATRQQSGYIHFGSSSRSSSSHECRLAALSLLNLRHHLLFASTFRPLVHAASIHALFLSHILILTSPSMSSPTQLYMLVSFHLISSLVITIHTPPALRTHTHTYARHHTFQTSYVHSNSRFYLLPFCVHVFTLAQMMKI